MIEDYSGPNGETVPQGKVILPPPQEPYSPPVDTPKKAVRPEQLVRQPASSLPRNPLARLAYLWHADPAYKVLIIAIGTILLSSIIGVIVATNLFAQSSPQPSSSQGQVAVAPTATPVPTIAPTPTLAPTPTPMAVVQPTVVPTVAPTTAPTQNQNAALTLQIANIPNQANNGTTVQVGVTASQPNITVRLAVTYTTAPGFFSSNVQTTDANGNATIPWRINVVTFGARNTIIARVTAVAQNQNGQVVQSQTVTVQINPK